MSSQNMKNYLLVLQQKVLDFDMQQRELLHRLETNHRNALSQGMIFVDIYTLTVLTSLFRSITAKPY